MKKSLFIHSRPWVLFDAENVEHRQAYFDFKKSNSWTNCPWQFVLEDTHVDLVSQIESCLCFYYSKKEFEKLKTKVRIR